MDVFLETDRLVLRRFTAADLDNLVELDSDPDVMRYITGGRPTPCEEVRDEVLPAFSPITSGSPAMGSGRPSRRPLASSLAGSTSAHPRVPTPTSPSSATGCSGQLGARATPPRDHGR
jgi:hypothetical protein